MPGQPSIDVTPLRDALGACAKAAAPIRRAALKQAATMLTGDAQAEAPVRTGDLKASHAVDASDPDRVVIGAGISYAAVVHAVHPSKAGWFREIVVKRGPPVIQAALKRAFEDEIKRIKGNAGGTGGIR